MNNKKEVVSRLNEVLEHAESCWGYRWNIKPHEGLMYAVEDAKTEDESFYYFKDDCLCIWEINTYRKPEEIKSITPYWDDNEEEDDDWSFDSYIVFRGGVELLIVSQAVDGALGFLLEVKGKKIMTQDPEEIKAYFAENK